MCFVILVKDMYAWKLFGHSLLIWSSIKHKILFVLYEHENGKYVKYILHCFTLKSSISTSQWKNNEMITRRGADVYCSVFSYHTVSLTSPVFVWWCCIFFFMFLCRHLLTAFVIATVHNVSEPGSTKLNFLFWLTKKIFVKSTFCKMCL